MEKFVSKKFVVALVAIAVPIVNKAFGLSLAVEDLALVIVTAASYITGQAIVDFKKEGHGQ